MIRSASAEVPWRRCAGASPAPAVVHSAAVGFDLQSPLPPRGAACDVPLVFDADHHVVLVDAGICAVAGSSRQLLRCTQAVLVAPHRREGCCQAAARWRASHRGHRGLHGLHAVRGHGANTDDLAAATEIVRPDPADAAARGKGLDLRIALELQRAAATRRALGRRVRRPGVKPRWCGLVSALRGPGAGGGRIEGEIPLPPVRYVREAHAVAVQTDVRSRTAPYADVAAGTAPVTATPRRRANPSRATRGDRCCCRRHLGRLGPIVIEPVDHLARGAERQDGAQRSPSTRGKPAHSEWSTPQGLAVNPGDPAACSLVRWCARALGRA